MCLKILGKHVLIYMKSILVIILQFQARLSFDSLFKYTNDKLDHINDPDILFFIEKGIRGGIYLQ